MPRINQDIVYMKMALEFAKMSYAEKRHVGCLIVKNKNIISTGYNGMPTGFNNVCETMDVKLVNVDTHKLKTKPEVLHAESNAILKCAKEGYATDKSTMYCTLAPCFDCAKLIVQSGVLRFVYLENWKHNLGLALLMQAKIKVEKIEL
jgi:dCMP deaminase